MLHFEVIPGYFWVILAVLALGWAVFTVYSRRRNARYSQDKQQKRHRNMAHNRAWHLFRIKPKQLTLTDQRSGKGKPT